MLINFRNLSIAITALLFLINNNAFPQQFNFNHQFAPTEKAVVMDEQGYRDAVCLNGKWQFYPVRNTDKLSAEQIKNPIFPAAGGWEATPVKVPSPWNVNNFATENIPGGDFVAYPSYPKTWEDIRAGWLSRKLLYKREWKNKRLILNFDGVGGYTQVYINKHKVAENFEVFLPFEVDITGLLKPDQENELIVWVADGSLLNKPGKYGRRIFVGGSFWGQHVRGIWQDVNLLVKPGVYIADTYIQPFIDKDTLAVSVKVKNTTGKKQAIDLDFSISPWINLAGKSTIEAPEVKWQLGNEVVNAALKKITIAPATEKTVTIKIKADGRLKLWEPDSPNLYGLIVTSLQNGTAIDKKYTRFGWRQFTITDKDLRLNGKPIILKGDSWHFMGIPQMTRRYAWAWYSALKDAHANAVRLHAQPYPAFYLDMADEMGICVLDESGLWASDGGPKIDDDEYWKNTENHLERFILRDRNHPSVFGWSVCNENLAVAIDVFNSPDSLIQKQVDQINKWVTIARKTDSTRTWISGDGETNRPTDLPTVIGHYGDENTYRDWSSKGKAWGIGEAGMAYYGTPKQTAVINGNASYRSQEGRMQGIATEAIKLLNGQKKYKASYLSIFNIVWYGLKPLELGLTDITRKPTVADGIYFGPYVEGQGGVQPERLGPYTTTLNPGYDPQLSLYRKWPLFDAVQKSFADTGAVGISNEERPTSYKNIRLKNRSYLLISSTDPDSALYHMFREIGVTINKPVKGAKPLLIVDGTHGFESKKVEKLKNEVLKKGGTVFFWGINETSKANINELLPFALELTNRKATSYLGVKPDVLLNNLGDSDFYFSEVSNTPVTEHGLQGPLVTKGKVILASSNTNWNVWNKQAEYLKTAAIIRSEREVKPAGDVMIELPVGNGTVYISTIDALRLYNLSPSLVKTMLSNLGIASNGESATTENALSADGYLPAAMFIGPFSVSESFKHEIKDVLLSGKEEDNGLAPGHEISGKKWRAIKSTNSNYTFNTVVEPIENECSAYFSFWIYSPRSLSNLLLEPDMPKVNLEANSVNAINIYFNHKVLNKPYTALPIEKGWNHIVIEGIGPTNDWKMKIRLTSTDSTFLQKEVKVKAYRISN